MKRTTETGITFGDRELCKDGVIHACETCYRKKHYLSFKMYDAPVPFFSLKDFYKIIDSGMKVVHCDKGRIRAPVVACLLDARLRGDDREFTKVYHDFCLKYGVSGWRGTHSFVSKHWKKLIEYEKAGCNKAE